MRIVRLTAVMAAVCVAFSFVWLYAQIPVEPDFELGNPEYRALAKRFDALAAEVRKSNAETAKKLDQVLSNQEKIISELAIVKVRASMR